MKAIFYRGIHSTRIFPSILRHSLLSGKPGLPGRILDKLAPPEGVLLLILAVAIGGGTGLAAVFFIKLIALIQNFFYVGGRNFFTGAPLLLYLVVPIAGSLLSGPLIAWFAKEAKGHGVPEVMQALILRGGRIRPRVALAKIAASALCIGTGGSAGREGPIVQVGSALGSTVGQLLHLSDERIRNLVSCGAAAGIAATFNAPIAGVAFAIEILMSELQVRMFGSVVIAAVSSSIVSQMYLGSAPAFIVPSYAVFAPLSIVLYLLLGLVAATVGVGFIRLLDTVETRFDAWRIPLVFKPAIGALLLGIIGMVLVYVQGKYFVSDAATGGMQYGRETLPRVYGAGFDFIESTLQGRGTLLPLVVLLFLKPLATSLTLGSGNSGGVFAPSLFIGAMLGGAFGKLCFMAFPTVTGPPGAYALVGMAAVFSAAARAPLTSMLIVFEMSSDYSLILPLMVAAVSASYCAQWLYADSIYTVKLTRRGIRFAQGKDMDIMQGVLVREVMNYHPVVIHKKDTLEKLEDIFRKTNFLGFPVVDEQEFLWGIVTLQDMNRAHTDKKALHVEDIAVRKLVTVFADEPIWTAIQKMAPRDLARLPVVSRENPLKLEGLISRSEILRAYEVAIARKQRGQLLDRNIALRHQKDNLFMEFVLTQGDNSVGKKLRKLKLPRGVNVVSIERGNRNIVANGDTRFDVGDVVTIYGNKQVMQKVRQIFTKY